MTTEEFRAALTDLGLTQSGFCQAVEAAGGERLPLRTAQSWATGERAIPPLVPAILGLLRQQQAGRTDKKIAS